MAESPDVKIPWPGWRAVRLLGRGSYGSVWEIERDVAGEPERCALKVVSIPPEGDWDGSLGLGYDEGTLSESYGKQADQVLHEYQLMASLSHSNIVACRDVAKVSHAGDPGCDVFIRMELLTPLPRWLKGRDADPRLAARVGRDIARALEACEKRGVVHRDVKPANIMVDEWGDFKLGDFGVARTMEGTRTATVAGTQSFMAPEVERHERYNQTVDIYSLGLVMWWMLNGYRGPFMPAGSIAPGDVARAEAMRLQGEPIPTPDNCPSELACIVLRACAYRPGDRYQSAAELVKDLDAFLEGRRIPAPEPNITEPVMHGGRETGTEENNWVDPGDGTVGKDHGNGSTPVAVPLEAGPTVAGPSGHTPGGEAKPAGKLETDAPQAHPKQSPRNEEPPEPAPPVPGPKAGAQGNGGTGISRRAFIIGGTAAAAAALAGFAVAGQNGSTSGSTPSSSSTSTFSDTSNSDTSSSASSTDDVDNSSTTVSASTSGIITLPVDSRGSDRVACDYSSATPSPATQIVGKDIVGSVAVLVLRCRDGSSLVVTEGDANQELLEEVAAWTDLRKVWFGEHSDGTDYVPYALGQRDDGGFVTTWVELADKIASDTSGSWSGVADFSVSVSEVDVITVGGEWLRTYDGVGDLPFEVLSASGRTAPGGSLYPSGPVQAFAANGYGSRILLMRDGTCWSTYEEGGLCGDAIRSWTGIVQCIDAYPIFAALSSDGTVRAATSSDEEEDSDYDEQQQIVKELSGWSDISKLDAALLILGVTSGGDVLILDTWRQLNTLDLGLSGIVDAKIIGDWIVTIDGDGQVKATRAYKLLMRL
ncbi:MAG: serine/threonine protein kinase [Olsenella sp.]|jgi:serine/threonine protein kinase|nr:serine/threonine protein kinase [Olsenella sp.]